MTWQNVWCATKSKWWWCTCFWSGNLDTRPCLKATKIIGLFLDLAARITLTCCDPCASVLCYIRPLQLLWKHWQSRCVCWRASPDRTSHWFTLCFWRQGNDRLLMQRLIWNWYLLVPGSGTNFMHCNSAKLLSWNACLSHLMSSSSIATPVGPFY